MKPTAAKFNVGSLGAQGISMESSKRAGRASICAMVAATCGILCLLLPGAASATDVRLFGFVGYSYSGRTADLQSDGAHNLNTRQVSNLLRLELWAFPSPYTTGASGYRLAVYQLDALDPSTTTGALDSGTLTYAPPPSGIWHFAMMLTEYTGADLADDGYVFRYWINFPEPEYIGVAPPPKIIGAIEFYHAGMDHYFVATSSQELSDLDLGVHPGWTRTGLAFGVWDSSAAGTSPVCRFYIPPGFGDSHFFSASTTECSQTSSKFPWLIEESIRAFYVAMPDTTTGACANNALPVYRLWNGRADSNHRYTTSAAIKSTMIANGYVAEGYGPNQVAMCSAE